MDLLERYLKQWANISRGHPGRCVAELRVNLQAEMDDLAEGKATAVTEAETTAILTAQGRPMLVAARILPQRYLNWPEIFPFYLLPCARPRPWWCFLFCGAPSTFIFARVLARSLEAS